MSDLIKHAYQLIGIAKNWAIKNLPNFTDDNHRDLLARHGAIAKNGRISATTLNMKALEAVLKDYEQRGWHRERSFFSTGSKGGAGSGLKAKPITESIRMIVRLWSKLGQAGKIKIATRPTLLAFCTRQTQREIKDLDSLSPKEQQSLIEALKAMHRR